jgi:probable HAF family extracellular repeat protein
VYSHATAINNNGDVAGVVAYAPSGDTGRMDDRGFLRRASDGTVVELPRPTNAIAYPAIAINDSRDVVGHFYTSVTESQAYLWRESTGQIVELGTFGGDTSRAEAINNAGDIVGYATDAAGAAHAFVRPIAGNAITPLAELDGALRSYAFDINDAGVIVGAADFTGATHAVLWDAQGKPTDLDAWLDTVNPAMGASWTIHTASAINASGMVVGTGIYNDGAGGLSDGTRAYVLDASPLVPEPASAALLAPLALLALRRRRR